MSLKDNFNQAVKEILRKDGLVGDGLKGNSGNSGSLAGMGSLNSPGRKDAEKMAEGVIPGGISPDSLSPDAVFPGGTPPEGYATDYSADERSRGEDLGSDPFADFDDNPPEIDAAEPASDTARRSTYERFEYNATAEDVPPPPPPVQQGTPHSDSPLRGGTPYTGHQNREPNHQGGRGGYGAGYGGGYGNGGYGNGGYGSFSGGRPPENPYYETEETTIISRNTRINGDISSFANVNVEGSVQGDIKLTKNIAVSGKVVGNIECNNAVMSGAQMQGSISSKGQVQMDHDSVLLGNIGTQYLDLNGRIKGSVEVGGKAEFKNDAVIVGDITASTISVIDGAVIKGYVNTTFMQESASNVFPEAISVGE